MDRLAPVVFTDEWGSHIHIASLQGRPIPSAERESELWMGAHPAGAAGVDRGEFTRLDELIAADPGHELGPDVLGRFGPRLPFLLKVLAPGRAISIQAHPTAEQARSVRDAAAPDERDTVYVDDEAKPEMLVAIAPFEVFVGLREHAAVTTLADRLGVPRFHTLVADTTTADDPVHALLSAVLAVPAGEQTRFVRDVVAACVRVEATADEVGRACAAIVRVAEDHPDDIGLAVLLLMNHRVIEPGQYIDVPAGVLHSYVNGLGIEVLANSDNVVRAGLTSKPINVPELLRIVDPGADGTAGSPVVAVDGVETYESHSDRFTLHRVRRAEPTTLPGDGGPRIVLSLRGSATLVRGGERLELGAAESAFVSAAEPGVEVVGASEVYVVTSRA